MDILLFANDNILIHHSIKNYLESLGFILDACFDGQDALSKFKQNNYDLILMDVNLPSISGPDIIKTIRGIDSKVPILVFCPTNFERLALMPYVNGFFDQSTNEKELADKIREEINSYKESLNRFKQANKN